MLYTVLDATENTFKIKPEVFHSSMCHKRRISDNRPLYNSNKCWMSEACSIEQDLDVDKLKEVTHAAKA